tara:strand:- start:487 stop:909 length:423 start_codon:yes stop_codon:yes gene_type:complete
MNSIKTSVLGDEAMNIDDIRHIVLSYFGVAGLSEHKEKMEFVKDSIEILKRFNDRYYTGISPQFAQKHKNMVGGPNGIIRHLIKNMPPLKHHIIKKLYYKIKDNNNNQLWEEIEFSTDAYHQLVVQNSKRYNSDLIHIMH